MKAAPPNSGGWFVSLQRVGESLLALLRNRFELFTVEWQEEKLRLLNLLVWLVLAATLGVMGMFVAMTAMAFWLWTMCGYAGLVGLAMATMTAAIVILSGIRKQIKTSPSPFSQTVAEFKKDHECL